MRGCPRCGCFGPVITCCATLLALALGRVNMIDALRELATTASTLVNYVKSPYETALMECLGETSVGPAIKCQLQLMG